MVAYIGTDEKVHLKIYRQNIDQTGDRETRDFNGDLDSTDLNETATGIATFSALDLEAQFSTTLNADGATVAPGTNVHLVPHMNGAFSVFWAEAVAGGIQIVGKQFPGAGNVWSPTAVMPFSGVLPVGTNFQITITGVTPGGTDDGFLVTWETLAGILGQRFGVDGAMRGLQFVVGDPTSGTPGAHTTASMDDGRIIVGYNDGGDVSAQYPRHAPTWRDADRAALRRPGAMSSSAPLATTRSTGARWAMNCSAALATISSPWAPAPISAGAATAMTN